MGDLSIKTQELKLILQFNPHLNSYKNVKETLHNVLIDLISEKILAQEALNNPDLANGKTKLLIQQREREAIIEEFWRIEIFNKIQCSEEELKSTYFKTKQKRIIKFIQFDDEETATNLFNYLKAGKSFDDLSPGIKENIGTDTIQYKGELISIEDSVFAMSPIGSIKLVREGRKYFVIELKNVIKNIFTAEEDFNYSKNKLEKILKRKKSVNAFNSYKKTYLKKYNYKLDDQMFKELVQALDKELFENTVAKPTENENTFEAINFNSISNLADQTVAKFNDGEVWTVLDLLNRLSVSPYTIDIKERGKFRVSMVLAAKHILDDEVMLKNGISLGLDDSEYVQQEVQMWSDYYLYKAMLKDLIKSNSSISHEENIVINNIDEFLSKKLEEYRLKINRQVLDTLQFDKTDMVALKTHFPGRTIAPIIQPLPNLKKFSQKIQEYINNSN